jgi:hypothetical protein
MVSFDKFRLVMKILADCWTYSSLVQLEIDIEDPQLLRLLIGLLDLGAFRSAKASFLSILAIAWKHAHGSFCETS